MQTTLWVALGGAIGTIARYWIALWMVPVSRNLPLGTLLINVVGSFLISFVGTLTVEQGRYPTPEMWRVAFAVGICGGFTTFSSFSLQTLDLIRAGASGRALLYVLLSVVLCLAAVMLGLLAAQRLNGVVLPPPEARIEEETGQMSRDTRLADGTILAVLAERHGARACLDAAAVAASALDHPTVAALHVRVDPMRDILPTEEILLPAQKRAMEIEAMQEGTFLRHIFTAWVPGVDPRVQTAWFDIADGIDDEIRALGSQATLNVIANITPDSRGHARTAFHACLFKTHRPLLIVPHDYQARKPHRILIGWKDTPPSRRALAFAVPWLQRADAVRAVYVGHPEPLELAWAKEHLASQNIRADVGRVDRREGMPVAAQLLDEARQFGADWLLTGAYWHNEYAEWILGGVTDALLKHAELPLFMSH